MNYAYLHSLAEEKLKLLGHKVKTITYYISAKTYFCEKCEERISIEFHSIDGFDLNITTNLNKLEKSISYVYCFIYYNQITKNIPNNIYCEQLRILL